MAKARADGDDIVRRAKEQIARETSVALARLREEVVDLAVLGAGKIVASSMTPEAQKKLVSEFVDSLPQAKN
jgi:F0F1-type ATP synthase membrane subunit b/b'